MSMACFCALMDQPLRAAAKVSRSLLVMAYADDVYIAGPLDGVEKGVSVLRAELAKRGLELSDPKSQLFARDEEVRQQLQRVSTAGEDEDDDEEVSSLRGMEVVKEGGIEVVGQPLTWSRAFINRFLEKRWKETL